MADREPDRGSMKLLIVLVAALITIPTAVGAITPGKPVESLVTPILDLLVLAQSSRGEQQRSAYWQSGKLLARLFQLKTRDSDEALLVLMEFYVGEASGSDIAHEVTLRGKRMMPCS